MRSLSTRAAGLLILIGGIWGGLIPFVGPYFHFTLGPDKAWTWTSGRLWLDVLPGVVAVLGGIILMSAGPRLGGRLGALLGIAAGAWFAVGPTVSQFWHATGSQGTGNGGHTRQALESLTFHTGLGVLIVALAAYALPGLLRRRVVAEEAAVAGAGAGAGAAAERGAHADRGVAPERDAAAEPTASIGRRGRPSIVGGRTAARREHAFDRERGMERDRVGDGNRDTAGRGRVDEPAAVENPRGPATTAE